MDEAQVADQVHDAARRAREAAAQLAPLTRAVKDGALRAMADALVEHTPDVLAANRADVDAGRSDGLSDSLLDRLTLTAERIETMAQGLRDIAALPDPVGEVIRGFTLPNGLAVEPAARPARRRRDRLRGPSQRDGRRRRALPEERQRRAAARFGVGVPLERGARRRARAPRGRRRGCRPTPSQLVPGTDRASVTALLRRAAWSTW